MILRSPFEISARLLPAVKVGAVTISVEQTDKCGDSGRKDFNYYFDFHKRTHRGSGLQTHRGVKDAMASLLDFLSNAAGEYKYKYEDRSKEFPIWLLKWALAYQGELDCVRFEVEESDCIEE